MTNNCVPAFINQLAAKLRFRRNLTRFLVVMLLLVLTFSLTVRAEEETADQQYLKVYSLISQADSFSAVGNDDLAKRTYKEAEIALQNFKKSHPGWNSPVIAYRQEYVAEKINPRPAPGSAPLENAAVVAPKSEEKPRTKPAAAKIAAPSAAVVKLINAGAEPRQQLRVRSKVGDKQNLDLTTKIVMEMPGGQAMKMPATKMTMEVAVKSVSADGDMTYETTVGDATVLDEPGALPQVVETMKSSLNGMKGLSMTGTMSDQGVTKAFDIKIPAGVAPQMKQVMEQMKESMANMSVPFPDDAVGAGAKWEVKLPIKSQGMTIDQVTTYELVSVKDDAAKVTSKITQNAANQKVTNPAMPQMKIDLIKLTGEGSGDITFNLAKLLPVLATVKSSTETSMGMNVGGQSQQMEMKMDMNMRMEAK